MDQSEKSTLNTGPGQISALRAEAEACLRLGEQYDLREDPARAELQYRRALEISGELVRAAGDPAFSRMAREICTALADLCMQQGNMHGADRWYAEALAWEGRL